MTLVLIIIGLAIAALVLFRPTPRPMVIYVPIEVSETTGGGLGCLPLLVIGGLLLLLALGIVQV